LIKNRPIKIIDNYIVFSHIRIPISAPTAWVSPISDKQYTIGSLYLCLKYRVFDANYINECNALKIDFVSKSDMDDIVEYFTGKVDTSDSIDEAKRLETLI